MADQVPNETFVTRFTTRTRLSRLPQLVDPEKLEEVLCMCDEGGTSRAKYLDALCLSYFGPLPPRHPRSDRGRFHSLPDRCWTITCEQCSEHFDASRWDARYCSSACKQKAYRARRIAQANEEEVLLDG